MFGMGGAPPKPEWGEMYFHQKLQHVIDTGADFVFGKMKWWLPCMGVSMAASLFVFSQGEFVPQAYMLLSAAALPHPAATAFGQRIPAEAMGGGEEEGEEGSSLELDVDEE